MFDDTVPVAGERCSRTPDRVSVGFSAPAAQAAAAADAFPAMCSAAKYPNVMPDASE
jgi:hypothetical protein